MSTNNEKTKENLALKETPYASWAIPGFAMLFFTFILLPIIFVVMMVMYMETAPEWVLAVDVPIALLFILGCMGYVVQEPNEARVMIFFGKYVGTFNKVGYYWMNPFVSRRKLSLRVRNMDIEPIKVNDKQGNPVMIGMVLVWRIRDTYRAVFDIDSAASNTSAFNMHALESFVRIQSDAALREVTGKYAYDTTDNTDELTLRSGGEEINELLEHKINERLGIAGMEVVEARINYLAYAPEIAAVMLRRQQATAIISAREKIVDGAVTMVEMALDKIEEKKIADFTPSQRASMVSNLLVVLCSDEPATPVLNTAAN
jgi:regulator of protease activity HflC (stomatin/prohibitin superfamily)